MYQTLETWLQVAGPCCGMVRHVVHGGRGNAEAGGLADLLAEIYNDISQQQREALQVRMGSALVFMVHFAALMFDLGCSVLSYLHRQNFSYLDKCLCSTGPQTYNHILQSCPTL